jgi:hypothetical protein
LRLEQEKKLLAEQEEERKTKEKLRLEQEARI